jgi:hypothetical protein
VEYGENDVDPDSFCDSISCRGRQLVAPIRDHVFTLIIKFLEQEKAETEAVYRALVGLGNLVNFSSVNSTCK